MKQQRREHNNLATKFGEKNSSLSKPITPMQTLTKVDKAIIDDYYHMMAMDDVGWIKLTLCSLFFLLAIKDPFCTSTFTS